MSNVLIIGGTNKTAINVALELKKNNYSIECMTYRDKDKIIKNFTDWQYLDLFNDTSVEEFFKNQIGKKYDKIILFISNSAKPYGKNLQFERSDLRDFYGIFCVNYLILIKNLLSNLADEGSIIFISSSAADTGSSNITYSSGKALIQNYVISLINFLNNGQSACVISPGTILKSSFYDSLPETHPDRINVDSLASPEQITDIIIKSNTHNGKNIKVGWEEGWNK